MFLHFKPTESDTKTYEIIRDYYVSNGAVQGMYFIVRNLIDGEIKTVFLDKKDISDKFEPTKVNEGEYKLKALGVVVGEESMLIIEKGVWIKKSVLNKEVEIPAKKYTFQLKK